MKRNNRMIYGIIVLLFVCCILTAGCSGPYGLYQSYELREDAELPAAGDNVSPGQIPEFSGSAYVTLHNNEPAFDDGELTTESFENYAELDALGRCGTACASIGRDLMPKEERGNISPVKPSGWQSAKYDNIEGKYLYNRCHLIGFQLSGENANPRNLITGTRFLNVEGMLPFENQVAEYVRETGNHVLYRVTPVYEGDNLVAGGVQMEAKSVEDDGAGVCFNIYAYNSQPGITIDYATGESRLSAENEKEKTAGSENAADAEYVLNTNTRKYHKPSCSSVAETNERNREAYTGNKTELEKQGYEPCGRCKP